MDLTPLPRAAVITGVSRGIEKAIADILSAEGMKIVRVACTRPELEALSTSLQNEALVPVIALRKPDSPNEAVTASIEKFGRFDLLLNNAGAFLEIPELAI